MYKTSEKEEKKVRMNPNFNPNDKVNINITLRGRHTNETVNLDEMVRIRDLGLDQGLQNRQAPALDMAEYQRLMVEGSKGNPQATEQALRMLAELNEKTADFVAAGGATPADNIAAAVVRWVIQNSPKGHKYTDNAQSAEGYIITPAEISLTGPFNVDGENLYKAAAVGTWG